VLAFRTVTYCTENEETPLGVPFISGQIRRILPDVLRTLDC
jgi:hypothetical protein